MKTRTIIEHSQFREMLSYKPAAANKADKQMIKNELKDSIINFYSDKWYRLKDATRAAMDFICFTSADKGFAMPASPILLKWACQNVQSAVL